MPPRREPKFRRGAQERAALAQSRGHPAAPVYEPDPLPPLTVVPVNGHGPEDVLVDKGHVFTGVDDGRILRLTPDGRRLDLIGETGGRPLGLEWYPDGRLRR